jgi:polyribonucleotide nucleotidyltransferase
VALADAGIPMRDLIASCAAGKVADSIVLDLRNEEDNFGSADVPLGLVPRTGEIVLLQMDGDLSVEEFKTALSMSTDACHRISAIQKEALRKKYCVAPTVIPAEVANAIHEAATENPQGSAVLPNELPGTPKEGLQ